MEASNKFRAKLGPRFKYPYETWFDGNTRIIKKPADFTCEAETMADMIRKRAKKVGGFASAIAVDETTVQFCYFGSEEEAAK